MKKKKILYTISLVAFMGASLSSCDSFLDEMPDNRTTVDSEDKIAALLVSAYPSSSSFAFVNECMSDNIDDMGERYSNHDSRFARQVYDWTEMTEKDNDGTELMWESHYNAIAAANQALVAIEELGGPVTTKLKESMAEALMCRAYGHFILVNEFCKNYNAATSSTDPGIPYSMRPETSVIVEYSRGTVADVYKNIDEDIQKALPLLGDTHLKVPKYHFNTQAAYAFAARFYLFYEKWEKAAQYATECLGSNPKSMLRDWDNMESFGITDNLTPRTNIYIDATANSNLLLITAVSSVGLWAGNYSWLSRYTHDGFISSKETLEANNLWGSSSMLRCRPLSFKGGTMDRVLVAKLPYLFEETDPVSKTGFFRTVYPAFKADYTLLERAEAYILGRDYTKACADLTMWMQNWTTSKMELTPENIVSFYNSMAYGDSFTPTLKKHLYPSFNIDDEGSVQECMLQCVLNFKRIETIYEGFRWFDIKRYGINITRRTMDASSEPLMVTDSLTTNDKRRALQLPLKVIQAGMEANQR